MLFVPIPRLEEVEHDNQTSKLQAGREWDESHQDLDHLVNVPIPTIPAVGTLFHACKHSVLGGLSFLKGKRLACLIGGNPRQGNLEVCNERVAFTSPQPS